MHLRVKLEYEDIGACNIKYRVYQLLTVLGVIGRCIEVVVVNRRRKI